MKKRSVYPDTIVLKRTQGHGIISLWIWPYVILPASVIALLCIFFFIVGPVLLHYIGVNHSLQFWLTTFVLWAVAVTVCTLVWVYASHHLVKKDYYTIANNEVEQNQTNGIDKNQGTYTKSNVYVQQKSDCEEPDSPTGDQPLIQQYYSPSHPSLSPEDLPVVIQMEEVDLGKNRQEKIEEVDEDEYSQSEKHVVIINEPQTISASSGNLGVTPESDKCHPPRRVSYAGVTSVHIPPPESPEVMDYEKNPSKLYPPRPPTPRFPRGMRVGSNDSSISAHLIDLQPHHKQQKKSMSETPKLIHVEQEAENVDLEEVQVEQTNMEQGNSISTPSEKSESPCLLNSSMGVIEVKNSKPIIIHNEERSKRNARETKKVKLSDDFEKLSDKNRHKRMSLDRNQFLGWNPDEGVLAEADPGSKEREQMRWRRSLGTWRASTSTPWNAEEPEEQGNVDEEELDDVFQDEVENVPKSPTRQTHVMHMMNVTQTVVTVHSSDDCK